MVNLRLLHPTLPAVIIKELKNCVERLLWIVHNIGKRSALIIFEEFRTCDRHPWYFGLRLINDAANQQAILERTKFEDSTILSHLPEKARLIIGNASAFDRDTATFSAIGSRLANTKN